MRYQDWDVLLFADGSGTPIQEFRTASFMVEDGKDFYPVAVKLGTDLAVPGTLRTPTLVTYIPSLLRDAPFAVSLHSWTKPRFSASCSQVPGQQSQSAFAWAVRIVVDGICVSSTTFTDQTTWPQVIKNADHVDDKGRLSPLSFPAFNRTVLSRREWHISDDQGRIKVYITEGIRVNQEGTIRFQPLRSLICFSFQPAPLEYLQKCNIAWPNPTMLANPWKPSSSHASNAIHQHQSRSQRSTWNIPTAPFQFMGHRALDLGANPMPAPPVPAQLPFATSNLHPYPDMNSLSSRSTSLATGDSFWPEYSDETTFSQLDGACEPKAPKRIKSEPRTVRIPSDQVREIIAAISHRELSYGRGAQAIDPARNKRARNLSDISMHAGCTGYPDCITTDPRTGEFVHVTPLKHASQAKRVVGDKENEKSVVL